MKTTPNPIKKKLLTEAMAQHKMARIIGNRTEAEVSLRHAVRYGISPEQLAEMTNTDVEQVKAMWPQVQALGA